jgi:NAD(P)H-dependent FMN reductase
MKKIITIQGSMNPHSRTNIVVQEFQKKLEEKKYPFESIDLREIQMDFCDGRKLEEYDKTVQSAYEKISKADILVFGMPVYCYSISGPLKNFIDITSDAMKNKQAGIICNAGSPFAYLAAAELQKILSFEAHVVTFQPVIKTSKADFTDGKLTGEKVFDKMDDLIANFSHCNCRQES